MTAPTAKVVLRNSTLRWSTPRTLNDPFDVQFDLRVEVDRAVVRELALQKLWDDHYGPDPGPAGNPFGVLVRAMRGRFPRWTREEFEAQFRDPMEQGLDRGIAAIPGLQAETREHMRDSKILCLTTAPENLLMWTHYAGQHTGAVLRFRDVPGLDSPWREARPVNYVAEMPLLADNELLSDIMSGRGTFDMASVIDRLVYTKSEPFAYEQEWRIYSGSGRNAGADYEDLGFHPDELDAVVLGARMDLGDREEVIALVREIYPHAAILQAELAAGRFGVDLQPL